MKVAYKRWGEVTIKKQGEKKNEFDKGSKSFSILNTKHEYTVEQLYELFTLIVDLTEEYPFEKLKKKILD